MAEVTDLQIGLFQPLRLLQRQHPRHHALVEDAHVIGPAGEGIGLAAGVGQHQILGDKLDIHHAAGGLLEVELAGTGFEQVIPHLVAHLAHLAGQSWLLPLLGQYIAADAGKLGNDGVIAIDGAGPHQCLMLPGPRLVLLILLVGRQRRHQQAGVAGGAQPHIDLVENAGWGAGAEQVQDPLGEAQIELAAVDGLAAICVAVGVAAMQKHQIEIRAVAQLDATQLAIGHHRETALAAQRHLGRHPVALAHLGPGLIDHLLGDRLRQPGEVVAHLHQRQGASDIGCHDTQQLYLLELAQCLHLLLHILFGDAQQELAQLGFVLIERGGVIEVLGIEQLVQQNGVAGQLLAHQMAGVAQPHQLAQGARVFRQQLQISAAGEDAGQQLAHPFEQAGGLLTGDHQPQQLRHQPVQRDAPLRPYLTAFVLLLETQ